MPKIKIGDCIHLIRCEDRRFIVTNIHVGYKKDCFETDIGEMYFMDNRYKSWKKEKKNAKQG